MATIAQDIQKGRRAKKLRGLQAISGLKLTTSILTHGRIKQRLKRGMVICSYRCFHHSCLNAFVKILNCQHKNRKDFGLGQMENDWIILCSSVVSWLRRQPHHFKCTLMEMLQQVIHPPSAALGTQGQVEALLPSGDTAGFVGAFGSSLHIWTLSIWPRIKAACIQGSSTELEMMGKRFLECPNNLAVLGTHFSTNHWKQHNIMPQ